MSNDGVNTSRRTFLIGLTSAVGAAGALGAAVPFVKSWQPSAKAENAGAPVQVDISKLEMGQRVVQEWRGQPVWVIRRSEETVSALDALNDQLKDPQSEQDQQPAYASSLWRSIKKRISDSDRHLHASGVFSSVRRRTHRGTQGGWFLLSLSRFQVRPGGPRLPGRTGADQHGGAAPFLPERVRGYRRL